MNSFFKILRQNTIIQNSVRYCNSTFSSIIPITNDGKKLLKRRCCFVSLALRYMIKLIVYYIIINQLINSCLKDDLFVIVRAVPNEFPDILDLFRANYNMKEPIMVGIGLAGKQNIAFDNQLMSGLLQGMTLVAKCRSSGLIAGACVNIGTCKWDSYRNSRLADSCNCEKMRDIMKFFAFVTQAPNLYNHCHEMKIFEVGLQNANTKFISKHFQPSNFILKLICRSTLSHVAQIQFSKSQPRVSLY